MIFFSVLYSPEENAIHNILLANKAGFKSVVYLNCVGDVFKSKLDDLNVIVLGDNKNVGLGVAFYELETYLSEVGEEYYIYFDQDTVTTEETWKSISATYLDAFSNKNSGMVFYGNNTAESSDLVVSSGCLFSMAIINKIGRHDRGYFVEGVDYEFCLRLKINGLVIYNVFTDSIDHFALQDGKRLSFAGLNIPVRVYGESRTRDFNTSHARLIRTSLRNGKYVMLLNFLKSAVLFNLHEHLSRFIVRFF